MQLNQTVRLQCRVAHANPKNLTYSWEIQTKQDNQTQIQTETINSYNIESVYDYRANEAFQELVVSCSVSNGIFDTKFKKLIVNITFDNNVGKLERFKK